MTWATEYAEMKSAGFTDDEIATEGDRLRREMSDNGFNGKEIDEYFGIKNPDMAPVKQLIENNIKAASAANAADPNKKQPEEAKSFLDAIQAGFQMSSGYLAVQASRGKSITPEMLLPEDAPTFYRIASQAATIAGDVPAMIVGAFAGAPVGTAAGGAIGSVVPVAGTAAGAATGAVVGAGAGANALPTAIRETLMQYYEKGEIKDFKDFWERASAVFIDTAKSAAVGGVSMGVGGKVGGALLSKGVAPTAARIAAASAEVSTMVAVGKGLEGEVPSAQDFTDAALLVGAMHVATKAPTKLRQIYAKTGVRPAEVLQEAQVNPVVRQDLLADGDAIPEMYSKMADQTKAVEAKPEMKPGGKPAPASPELQPKVETPAEPTAPATPQETILSKVGVAEEAPKKAYTRNDFYKDYVDRLDPVALAVKELGEDPATLMADKNPYKLSRMANDSKAKVQHFFEKGPLDYKTLETTGKSYAEIIAPFKDDVGGLKAYAISKRVLEVEGRGIKSGFDVEAAKQVVKEGAAKYDKAANEMVEFRNAGLKYLKDSGFLSEEAFTKMQDSGLAYLSLKRISEEGTVAGGSKSKPIKKLKGSDLSIQDPFISDIENLDLYVRLAERNRAVRALVDLADKTEGQTLLEKVPTPMKPVEVSKSEVAKLFKEKGIDADPETFTIFRGADKQLAPNEIEVYRDGKREIYRTERPELAEAIKTLEGNAPAQNIILKLARGLTTAKRLGISLAPDFILRNWFRDQLTAGTFTKGGTAPFMDVFSAMGDIIQKNDSYYNWLKAGGANGAFIELGDKYLANNIFKLDAETKFIDRTWNVVKKPIHYLEMMGQLAEQASRLAEAKRVMKGDTKGGNVFEAGFASREATIDFQRMGAKVSALNSITAFQNAQIQGLDRAIRAVKDDPAGVALKASMYITAPSVLLWWANKDDERVKEIPRWQKDLFWIIPTDKWVAAGAGEDPQTYPEYLRRQNAQGQWEINKGTIYRLPKPQELGVLFGSVPERILDKFFGENPDAMRDFEKTMTGMLTPSLLPDAVAPVAEQFFNKSLFTDNKIVPAHLEGIMPQYQYTDYTTDTAKALGKMVAAVPFLGELGPKNVPLASPMVIENYVRSWSGTMGMYALQLADKGLQAAGLSPDPVKPAAALADIPFVKAFVVRYPNGGTESIQKFQDRFEKNKVVLDTIKTLSKRGSLDEAATLMQAEENQAMLQDLSGTQEALKNQGQFIQMVYKNPDITPEEKRQIIDGAYYGMIATAQAGMQMVRTWEKSLEEQKKSLEGGSGH